jgi:Family of unknown function (DUF6614)
MDSYHLWCNLKPGVRDLEFAAAIEGYLGWLRGQGLIAGYRLQRRKLGFGPPGLGEFHVAIETTDLAQLERAFQRVATREGEVERLHARVYSAVTDLVVALYRDFPDPVRGKAAAGGSAGGAGGASGP